MSNRTIGRTAGILFLAAFVCYGAGQALVERPVGTALMLLNSGVVVTLGALVFQALRPSAPTAAAMYLLARAIEAILLAVGVVSLVWMRSAEGNDLAYQLGMLTLGVGSVPFCYVLLRQRIAPIWLGIWGMVGYAVLACGAMLELLGVGAGLLLSIPGGLFEIALGLLLIAHGFPEPAALTSAIAPHVHNDRLGARA